MKSWLYCGIALSALVCVSSADVLRVPQRYSTIQSAFNAVDNDDTVLVALGTYAEELTAPPRRFWLMGDVEIDTGDFPKPVIDPSSLDSANRRMCLQIPEECELTIERMRFVNRAPMYPRIEPLASGGVVGNSALPLTIRNCCFDSVYRAVVHRDPIDHSVQYVIEDCRFANAPRIQIRARASARLEVRRCTFHGRRCVSQLIFGGDNSVVEECVFTADSTASGVLLRGDDLILRNCVFGPIDTCAGPVLRIDSDTRAVVADNLFRDITMYSQTSIWLDVYSGLPVFFLRNQLRHISSGPEQCGPGITISRYSEAPPGLSALIDSNVFESMSSGHLFYSGKVLSPHADISATANRFVDLEPDTMPTVTQHFLYPADLQFRNNLFEAADYAIASPHQNVDAILNYWGDSTGPYNERYHPEGRGARVDDLVQFDPWLPDTSFLSSVKPRPPLPSEFSLEAYPNPFNRTVILRLIPSDVRLIHVDLFDVLGRQVSEIWRGPLGEEKRLSFDASAFASGTYFVRVTDTIDRYTLAQTKLVLLK